MFYHASDSLDDPETFSRQIQHLGGRHAMYGVKREDYVEFSYALANSIATYVLTRFQQQLNSITGWLPHQLRMPPRQLQQHRQKRSLDRPGFMNRG
jgi:hypothetical protein